MTDPDGKSGANQQQKQTNPGATRIAVLGYGAEARDRAVRLRHAGIDVSVSMRPGGLSWVRANADKFAPAPADEAVASAEVVVLLVPDEEQPAVYWRNVAPHITPGALLVVERGHALYLGMLEPKADLDVVLVTAGASGTSERPGCRVAVYRDATGRALERAIAYARAAFPEAKVSLGTTTVSDEVEADLAAREARAGGHEAFVAELDQILVRGGAHEPDEAKLSYYERLRACVAVRQPTTDSRRAITAAPTSATDVAVRYWTQMRGVA